MSTVALERFTQRPRCPKCRGTADPDYISRVPINSPREECHGIGEHLHWTCGDCGYRWATATADAP